MRDGYGLTFEDFVCPDARRIDDDSLAALVGLAGPVAESYRYLGTGLTRATAPRDALLLIDRLGDHERGQACIARADGRRVCASVAWNGRPTAGWRDVEAQIARGGRPVRWPTTRAAS